MPAAPNTGDEFSSIFVSAADGLRLHARCIGSGEPGTLPVVCLPGLTRTANDFDILAHALAHGSRPRRVIAIDYRGRGRSDYDSNPDHYSPAVELADVLTVLAALGAMPAVFVGTSRGGILTMLLAATQPAAIAAAILNDIGPVIELEGLLRIKSYVGKMPEPKDFAEAAATLRHLFGPQFPELTEADWLASARRAFKEQNGRFVPTYDTNLARTLDGVAPDKPLPALWPQFDALAAVPVMVVRGALSDLLSTDTVAAMGARRTQLDVLEVPHQGHAPLLAEPETIARIAAFIDRADPPRL
jgi:pimeloyl-ACP methyl ester carboxylesterase